jgi:hypothetical protein
LILFIRTKRFVVGEAVTFQSSGINGEVSAVIIGDKNIVRELHI